MSHSWTNSNDSLIVEYNWRKGQWNSLKVTTHLKATPIKDGSEEEFMTGHYWGYTKISNERTSEYGVEHPKWEVYETKDYLIDVDFGDVYGQDFSFLTTQKPVSVFLAEGSEIKVKEKTRHLNLSNRT